MSYTHETLFDGFTRPIEYEEIAHGSKVIVKGGDTNPTSRSKRYQRTAKVIKDYGSYILVKMGKYRECFSRNELEVAE